MKATGLKAACLAVGLATAWGSPASAQIDEIQLTITPSNNLTHVYFFYGPGTTSLWPVTAVDPLPNLQADETTVVDLSVTQVSGAACYVLGLYNETNNLVSIGVDSNWAQNVIGQTNFNAEFVPFTEDQIATALLSNDIATLDNFVTAPSFYGYIRIGSSGRMVDYSIASDGGSVLTELIPEPSPMLLVTLGALIILWLDPSRRYLLRLRPKRLRDP
jgi:hypothetical protein